MHAVYQVNEAGARTIREAKPMTFGVGRYVTAHVDDDVVTVFVGLSMHYNGVERFAGIRPGSPEFYDMVRTIAIEGEKPVTTKPKMPTASDYSGDDLKAYQRGRAAARRYYAAMATRSVSYCEYIERADKRDEPSAWYDGFDAIANPEYFAA